MATNSPFLSPDELAFWKQVYVAVIAKQGCTWETAETAADRAVETYLKRRDTKRVS